MNLTNEIREDLWEKINRDLEELGLSNSFKLSIRRADKAALIITICPRGRGSKLHPDMCQAVTTKGWQCKIPPAPGEEFCPAHLAMSQEGK